MSPDKRCHRGAHPQDERLFAEDQARVLCEAVGDLAWLLSRGYAMDAALKLVGDHFQLEKRQRLAVMRSACSDQALRSRHDREISPSEVKGKRLLLDGFNVLIGVEAALGGGVILEGRDGCYRDLASVHGTYRTVEETEAALRIIGKEIARLSPSAVIWYLDKPVSNSGRVAGIIRSINDELGMAWEVELVMNPDSVLSKETDIIATSDSVIIDSDVRWINLVKVVIQKRVQDAWLLQLSEKKVE